MALSRSPVSYEKCNQTVTVYHQSGEAYTQTVYPNAFLEFQKTQEVGKTGSTEKSSFLLVIPTDKTILHVGDKVLLGEGKAVANREEWAALIPSKVSGLVVIRAVDDKYWRGKIVHTEATG